MQEEHGERVQRAVAFFRRAGLERLLVAVRQKYLQLGLVGGQVQLSESSAAERRELASFLGRAPYQEAMIRIKLATLDAALQQSGFQCTLPELLAAFFPDQPLITRPQQRAATASQQEQFYQSLQALVGEFLPDSRACSWLLAGQHGLEWLFARYKNAPPQEQLQQHEIIRAVALLLNQLPLSPPERLGIFAQRTSGDPHSLDQDRPLGRLFLQALGDLASERAVQPKGGRVQELQLYQDAGLLVDTISSNVAVFHLTGAEQEDGSPDPLPGAAGARILLLPLRQILAWQAVSVARPDIYIIENPQVFEEVVTSLQASSAKSASIAPTVICTSGWPSVAALLLLDLALSASTNNRLHYSGDFDLKGLQIATYMQERYPDRCSLWHLDPAAYHIALKAGGVMAPVSDLALLKTLPIAFYELSREMQAQGKWAYQEGITHLLGSDCCMSYNPI